MSGFDGLLYCCALRMKKGELEGVRLLAPDVAKSVLPRFIVPPRPDRNDAEPLLIEVVETPDIAGALTSHWRGPALVDASYILDEFGRERAASWLPAMFARARAAGALAIPMAVVEDLGEAELPAFKASLAEPGGLRFAVCVPSDELVDPALRSKMHSILAVLGIEAADCAVIADFGGAELADPAIVAPVIENALETLQEIGLWRHVIFQGTNYPEVNPAKDGAAEVWPRNEWLAWKMAVRLGRPTGEQMLFGDYAADCSRMSFGGGGAQAIRHLRYATEDSWLIQRAVKEGRDVHRMHGVYKALACHERFAGAGFSAADAFIARAARDPMAKPGNATKWRELNITHHITRVVSDIAGLRGFGISMAPSSAEVQLELLARSGA